MCQSGITVGRLCWLDVLIMISPAAHRAQSRLPVPGIQHESEDESNGEIAQRVYGATTGRKLQMHM